MTDVIITSHFARTHKCILTIRKTAEPMEQNWQSKVQYKKMSQSLKVLRLKIGSASGNQGKINATPCRLPRYHKEYGQP